MTSNEGGNSNLFRWRDKTDFLFKSTLRNAKPLPNVRFILFRPILKRRMFLWNRKWKLHSERKHSEKQLGQCKDSLISGYLNQKRLFFPLQFKPIMAKALTLPGAIECAKPIEEEQTLVTLNSAFTKDIDL